MPADLDSVQNHIYGRWLGNFLLAACLTIFLILFLESPNWVYALEVGAISTIIVVNSFIMRGLYRRRARLNAKYDKLDEKTHELT